MTLLEVMVVVLCLFVLFAIIAPAIYQTRTPARRTVCLNNIRNLAIATINYSYAHASDGVLPLLEDGSYGWPAQLSPVLDQMGIELTLRGNGPDAAPPDVLVPLFTCPDDGDSFGVSGGLSYASNAGYGDFRVDQASGAVREIGTHSPAVDRNGDGEVTAVDLQLNLATGVFWRAASIYGDSQFRVTMDGIQMSDGLAQTLLFAENANAGQWHSRRTMDLGFVIGREVLQFETGPASSGPLQLEEPVELGAFSLNRSGSSQPGRSPTPSSYHDGLVIVAFCDGRAIALSKDTDSGVYARLMTPAGERFGQDTVPVDAY